MVFKSLEAEGFTFQRGQLVLISAAPGTFKSGFALTLALKSEAPTLYLSADSDAFIQRTRALSIVNGIPMAESARAELNGSVDRLEEKLKGIPTRLYYDASPSLDTIERELAAYYEVFAEYPHLIIVDNITNIRTGTLENDENPFAGMEGLMDYLHGIARETSACVLGLHHTLADYNNGDKPIPLNGVKGQISRVPPVVLTMFRKANSLCVSIVKNRGGKQDPTGNTYAELFADGDKMSITDPSEGR